MNWCPEGVAASWKTGVVLERFRDAQTVVLRPVARWLVRAGVQPDAVTWFGAIGVALASLILFPRGLLWQGAVVVLLLSLCDMIDGHMAREAASASRWGTFLDSTLDRVADAGVLGGLAWFLATHSHPGWAVVAVWSLVAAQVTSYAKARAEAVGAKAGVGMVTRADRIAIAVLGALLAGLGVPWALETAIAALALGGTTTVVQRLLVVHSQLSRRSQ